MNTDNKESLIDRLRIRASIRRSITSRKSIQEGKPDRIADLLEEAATQLIAYEKQIQELQDLISEYKDDWK
jgi:uncharacterized protein Yka (UPF0111/DUF47 family)